MRPYGPAVESVLVAVLFALPSVASTQGADHPGFRRFDRPDLEQVVQVVAVGDATITVYGSQPADELWQSPRDPVVYTAGTSLAPYFYPQLPMHDSVLLCAETKYYDLDNSRPVRVRIRGLEPNTTYYYRVNDSAELVRVRTQPPPGTFSPFQFTLTGDSQGPYDPPGDKNLNKDRHGLGAWPAINDAAKFQQFNITTNSMRRHVAPDFSISIGDVIMDGRYTVQWEREFFGWLKYYLTQAPVYMAMGNHERRDPRCWRYIELPLSGRQRIADRYFFSFNWGQAHFIAVDFNRHWEEIVDIDDVPASYRYKITEDVLSGVSGQLPAEKVHALGALLNHEYGPETLQARLKEMDFSGDENRSVRTAALIKGDERVDVSEYRPNAGHHQIMRRNVSLGRVSLMATMDEDLWRYQWEWLEEELASNDDKKYLFVFSHHPFCYGGPVRRLPVGEGGFDDLFEKHGVTATFSGHWHGFAHNRKSGVHYFQIGALSDTVFSKLQESPKETFVFHRHGPSYTVVDVEHDRAVLTAYNRENNTFHTVTLAPRN